MSVPLPPPLLDLVAIVDRLRQEVAVVTGRALVDAAELQVLQYTAGGHYMRHVDTGKSRSGALHRSVSFLLYLTDDEWEPATDGGELRIFDAQSDDDDTYLSDIAPVAGTLILFDSATVPHAVLPTQRNRLVIVGWLCEAG
jgi:SM-20-related protein